MSDERKKVAPTDYTPQQGGYDDEPLVSATTTSDTIEINLSIKMKLDPDKLRCLQDSGITCTTNVVT